MGSKGSKEEKKEEVTAVENVKSTGFHVLEVHAPTAGMSMIGVLVLLLILGALWICYRRMKRSARKQTGLFFGDRRPDPISNAGLAARLDKLERMGERLLEREFRMKHGLRYYEDYPPPMTPGGARALMPPDQTSPAPVVVPAPPATVRIINEKRRRPSVRFAETEECCDCGNTQGLKGGYKDPQTSTMRGFKGWGRASTPLPGRKTIKITDSDSDWDTETENKKSGVFAFP